MIALITRIVEGEGADRELDRQLALIGQYPNDGKMWFAPEFTSSVDAALAFAERMLPGWDFEVGTREKDDDENEASWYVRLTKGDYPYEKIASASHKEFARAILAATLTALQNKDTTNDRG